MRCAFKCHVLLMYYLPRRCRVPNRRRSWDIMWLLVRVRSLYKRENICWSRNQSRSRKQRTLRCSKRRHTKRTGSNKDNVVVGHGDQWGRKKGDVDGPGESPPPPPLERLMISAKPEFFLELRIRRLKV